MGNACIRVRSPRLAKLVFWGGATRSLVETQLAGEIMFEFPNHIVCHSESFFIGRPVPALHVDDELQLGQTYFVIPIDCFPCRTLTAASIAALSSASKGSLIKFSKCMFEHVKAPDGRMLVRVSPEFIATIVAGESAHVEAGGEGSTSPLCTTPELKKHYDQLVGSRSERPWSPKLETIAEANKTGNARLSPSRVLSKMSVDLKPSCFI